MLSRALSSATVMLLIGWFAAAPVPALAQATNLEAGKSPSQIFAGTCTVCHKSPRGLLKTVPAGSLPGFLREHYTTSPDMAGLLSSYLISNGASDTRYQAKPDKEGKPAAQPAAAPEQLDRQGRRIHTAAPTQEPAKPDAQPQPKPDADGLSSPADGRKGRNARRLARPGEAPDAAKPAVDGQAPAQAAAERGPDGRKLTSRQRLSKRGKPGAEEPPKDDAAKDSGKDAAKDTPKTDAPKTDAAKDEPAKSEPSAKVEPAKEDKPSGEAAKDNATKPESSKPPAEAKSEAAKVEPPKATGSGETPAVRADPAPAVTPAPAASAAPPTATSSVTPEHTPAPSPPPAAPPAAPAVAASAPPSSAPMAPAGPPVPPISQ
jgi:hypothetical protein